MKLSMKSKFKKKPSVLGGFKMRLVLITLLLQKVLHQL